MAKVMQKGTDNMGTCNICGRTEVDAMTLNSTPTNREMCYQRETGNDTKCKPSKARFWQGMTSPRCNNLNRRLVEALRETCDLLDYNEVQIPVRVLRLMSEVGLSVALKPAGNEPEREDGETEAERNR